MLIDENIVVLSAVLDDKNPNDDDLLAQLKTFRRWCLVAFDELKLIKRSGKLEDNY